MIFHVPVKPCGCGVLLGEVCDCAAFAAAAAAAPMLILPTGRCEPQASAEPPFLAAMRAAAIDAPNGAVA